MKVVIAMDSFKGSLTSLEAGNAVSKGILRVCPEASVKVFPLADGGEGTIDTIAPFISGVTVTVNATGPLGKTIESSYILDASGETAYIEMAKVCGLTLLTPEERDPFKTTTYGVGELIKDAALKGAKSIVLCIGGSATNDGGAGMLQALGARLTDKDGHDIPLGAEGLKELYSADLEGLFGRGLSITVASDVTNPLCGPDGASFVYGPQKGASPEACRQLDGWLSDYAGILGFASGEPGTGAAGGISFALKNCLGARIMSGAELVMEITGIEREISVCNIVITGEGRMDSQTVNGKAPYKILHTGLKYGKTVYGITGCLGDGYGECLKAGFDRIVPLLHPTMDRDEAIRSVEETAAVFFDEITGL